MLQKYIMHIGTYCVKKSFPVNTSQTSRTCSATHVQVKSDTGGKHFNLPKFYFFKKLPLWVHAGIFLHYFVVYTGHSHFMPFPPAAQPSEQRF